MGAPFVEVHLSDVDAREDFRKASVVRDIALATVKGQGPSMLRLGPCSRAMVIMGAAPPRPRAPRPGRGPGG
ncbi:MAG: type II 3-dehydroquinate dehydratase [Actinomycetota bacterium]